MSDKEKPLGICDHCGGPISTGEWYTSKGIPRQFCCLECKQTANSRAGNAGRTRKLKQRVESGVWVNPRSMMTTGQIREVQSRASRKARLAEVAENRWRNPALPYEARLKISKKRRKHNDDLYLALRMIEDGVRIAQLPENMQNMVRSLKRTQRERYKDMGFINWLKGQRDIPAMRVYELGIGIRVDLWPSGATKAVIAYDPDEGKVGVIPVSDAGRIYFLDGRNSHPKTSDNSASYSMTQSGRRFIVNAEQMIARWDIEHGAWKLLWQNEDGYLVFERDALFDEKSTIRE